MRRSIILGIITVMPLFFGSSLPSAVGKETSLILKITSEDQNEILTFEGSVFLGGEDSIFKTVTMKTPFQIERTTDVITAVLHKVSGKANLKIELLTHDGENFTTILTGTGTIMALTTDKLTKPYGHTIHIVE